VVQALLDPAQCRLGTSKGAVEPGVVGHPLAVQAVRLEQRLPFSDDGAEQRRGGSMPAEHEQPFPEAAPGAQQGD